MQIIVPTTFPLDELTVCKDLCSKLNSDHITVSGRKYSPYTLLYTGFGGTLSDPCKGRHTFEEITIDDARKHYLEGDLSLIPGLENASERNEGQHTVQSDKRNVSKSSKSSRESKFKGSNSE